MRRWTIHLIEQNLHLVEAVAKALLEHRELSGTEVRAVIDTANQEQSRMNVQPLLDLVQAAKEMQRSKESHT
jgi:hypothetical protein